MRTSVESTGRSIYTPHLDRALRLAGLTGLRLGDLVRLTWHDVGDKAIILKARKRKGRAIIPILPEFRALLDSIGRGDGEVLRNSRGQPWTESGLGAVFQKAKPESFDRAMHDLRGTYATWLAMRGLTDDEIARTIGWTAKRISEIRARYVDEARVVVSMVERLST
jgi:integrase